MSETVQIPSQNTQPGPEFTDQSAAPYPAGPMPEGMPQDPFANPSTGSTELLFQQPGQDIFKRPEANETGAVETSEAEVAVGALEGVVSYTQQVDSIGRKNVYGVTADGKKKHIGHDDVLAAFGYAGDTQGKKPVEAAPEDDPEEFQKEFGVTTAAFDAMSPAEQLNVIKNAKPANEPAASTEVPAIPVAVAAQPAVKRSLSEVAAGAKPSWSEEGGQGTLHSASRKGPLRAGWSEEANDVPQVPAATATAGSPETPKATPSPLERAAAAGPLRAGWSEEAQTSQTQPATEADPATPVNNIGHSWTAANMVAAGIPAKGPSIKERFIARKQRRAERRAAAPVVASDERALNTPKIDSLDLTAAGDAARAAAPVAVEVAVDNGPILKTPMIDALDLTPTGDALRAAAPAPVEANPADARVLNTPKIDALDLRRPEIIAAEAASAEAILRANETDDEQKLAA